MYISITNINGLEDYLLYIRGITVHRLWRPKTSCSLCVLWLQFEGNRNGLEVSGVGRLLTELVRLIHTVCCRGTQIPMRRMGRSG